MGKRWHAFLALSSLLTFMLMACGTSVPAGSGTAGTATPAASGAEGWRINRSRASRSGVLVVWIVSDHGVALRNVIPGAK